ncbi:MAG: twin-arginine translocase TatA/TatE family subunit, partial [Limimaricola soesokkakensis]|uniref:twin-arginine translocase TatA/TatE family subunit n=1 Tax=Limimaricola soesokkakensis TaxID=1343159 RepID=UPI0040589984
GRGKISSLMGEVGKGITAFKRGVDDGKKEIDDQSKTINETGTVHEPHAAEDKDRV